MQGMRSTVFLALLTINTVGVPSEAVFSGGLRASKNRVNGKKGQPDEDD